MFHERWLAPIHKREIQSIITAGDFEHLVDHAVDFFLTTLEILMNQVGQWSLSALRPDLLAALESNVVDRPDMIDEEIDEGSELERLEAHRVQPYFHDLLKACGMQLKVPIQMVRPDTYGGQKLRRNPKRLVQVENSRMKQREPGIFTPLSTTKRAEYFGDSFGIHLNSPHALLVLVFTVSRGRPAPN